MHLWQNVRIALNALSANRTRSVLTLLGIIIGTAAVIAVMSVGKGAQASVTRQIQSTGSNLLFIRSGQASQGNIRLSIGSSSSLTLQDAAALANPSSTPSLAAAAPEVQSGGQLVHGPYNTPARILGVTPEYEFVRNYTVDRGDFISAENVQARSNVVVLGANIAQALFPEADSLDQNVLINRRPFRVIGVLASRGGGSLGVQDDAVLMPLTTVLARLQNVRAIRGGQSVQLITAQAIDEKHIEAAKEEIAAVLRERHRIPEGADDDFNITTQEDILAALLNVTDTFTIFLGAIAGISLLVGGIGIMNIMLVSVTERTREIGLRKAVGAKRRHILAQFLTEAVVLSGLGGVMGVALGWAVSRFVSRINLNGQQLPSSVSVDIVLLAAGVSLAIGLFFGIYPASRASRLDPIQALRYE